MRQIRLFLTLAVLLALPACSDLGDEPTAPPPDPPVETVSFAADVQPIFDANCVGCHGEGGNAGLDLRSGQSYTTLVGVAATESALNRVEPGDAAASWLYLKMTGQHDAGTVMPPSGALDGTLTDRVRDWIEEGALDN
jgi:hypothetical protein